MRKSELCEALFGIKIRTPKDVETNIVNKLLGFEVGTMPKLVLYNIALNVKFDVLTNLC